MAKYHPLNQLPDEGDLKSIVSNFEYKRVGNHELPAELQGYGFVQKCNSFLVAASGSTDGMLYSCVGLRKDHNDIDEHPFVMYYDYQDASKNFGGIIDHGNWEGRTIALTDDQLNAMSASGLTASFTYKGIPATSSGSLDELRENDMLDGLSDQFTILMRNK